MKEETVHMYETLMNIMPVFFTEDVAIALADDENYLRTRQGVKFKLKVNPGDPVPQGGAVHEALHTGKTVIQEVPEKVYGTPFQSYAVPVTEGKDVVGVFVMGKSLEKKKNVRHLAEVLSESMQQISLAVNDISNKIAELSEKNKNIYHFL